MGRWGIFSRYWEVLLLVSKDYLCHGTVRYAILGLEEVTPAITLGLNYSPSCAGAGQGLVGVSRCEGS